MLNDIMTKATISLTTIACTRNSKLCKAKRKSGKEKGDMEWRESKKDSGTKKVIGIFNLMKLHSIKSENNSSIVLANIVE